MNPAPRPALRVALLGVAVTLLGYALFAGWLGVHAHGYVTARDRATATASGVVVEDGIGDESDIRVRWSDAAGHVHVQRFGIYDTDRYVEGERFPVAYDPATSAPRGFPADPEETAAEDDLLVPVFLAGVVALSLLCVWAWRGLRFRLTTRRPGHAMTATVRTVERLVALAREATTTWLVLTGPDGEGGTTTRWQRVMWHPALDDCSGPVPVTVRGYGRRRRPVVVELADGTRLVPLGRLRDHRPAGELLDADEAVRPGPRDYFVLPAGAVPRPARPGWRPGALAAACGTGAGIVLAFLVAEGTPTSVVGFALALGTLSASVWALSAPQPQP